MDRLTKIHSDGLSHYYYCDASNSSISGKYQTSPILPDAQPILCGDIVDRLAYYEDLVEQGRLIVLPCKEGTPIWKLSPRLGSEPVIEERYFNLTYDRHMQFGKDFFLAREEAEAALGGKSYE